MTDRATCPTCAVEMTAATLPAPCPHCGTNLERVTGDELERRRTPAQGVLL